MVATVIINEGARTRTTINTRNRNMVAIIRNRVNIYIIIYILIVIVIIFVIFVILINLNKFRIIAVEAFCLYYIVKFFFSHCTKKLSFLLRISSVNVIKSAVSCRFGHIY